MRRDSGFTLVGLLIIVAIVNLVLAGAMTSWVTLDKRARESELLWRGQQIARAIDCYGRDNAGDPLQRLDQLVRANCLRRLYGDPMSKSGQWRILTQQDLADGTVAALLGSVPEADQVGPDSGVSAASAGGLSLGTGVGGQGQRASFGARAGLGQPTGVAAAGAPRAGFGDRGGIAGASANVIVGVVSSASGKGLRTYLGRERYNEWVFLAGAR